MTNNTIKRIGDNLIVLAALLSDEEFQVSADEILCFLSGQVVTEEEAGDIERYLDDN